MDLYQHWLGSWCIRFIYLFLNRNTGQKQGLRCRVLFEKLTLSPSFFSSSSRIQQSNFTGYVNVSKFWGKHQNTNHLQKFKLRRVGFTWLQYTSSFNFYGFISSKFWFDLQILSKLKNKQRIKQTNKKDNRERIRILVQVHKP